jgi:hypothetical protein
MRAAINVSAMTSMPEMTVGGQRHIEVQQIMVKFS